jgi:alpha-beta hydrolase superfamily lysophospholipase
VLVLLAPAVVPRVSLRDRFAVATRRVAPTVSNRLLGWNGEVLGAAELLRQTTKEIACPTLVLQARDDQMLSTRGLKLLRKWLTHADSEVVLLPHGSHALTRGKTKEEVFDRIFKFTAKLELVSSSE